MVPGLIEEKEPCYIFYRMDEKNQSGSYMWLFLAYTPDLANVSDPTTLCTAGILAICTALYSLLKHELQQLNSKIMNIV